MDSEKYIRNVIVVSDLHCGCRLGLCPPEDRKLDQGGWYRPSPLQLKLWQWWSEFWDAWVPLVTRGEPYAIVVNGDTTNGRHHKGVTNISESLVDQKRIAKDVIRQRIDHPNCKQLYMVRGTEAHVGLGGENEEALAEDLGAVKNPDGDYAPFELWLRVGGPTGALVHIMHHIGTTGTSAYETTALQKEFTESCSEAGKWGNPAPDIVVRAHRHRHAKTQVPTVNGDGICVVTPGWQLKTPFVFRIPGGRVTTPQCGGILIRQGDEEFFTRQKIWNISRPPEVIL